MPRGMACTENRRQLKCPPREHKLTTMCLMDHRRGGQCGNVGKHVGRHLLTRKDAFEIVSFQKESEYKTVSVI
jgi:hypothetical protein